MQNIIHKWSRGGLRFIWVLLIIVSVLVPTLPVYTHKVHAASTPVTANNVLDLLCIPATTAVKGLGNKPNGWLSIEVINRAVFHVVISPSGSCTNQSRDMDSLMGESPGKFKELFDAYIVDKNAGDGNWSYVDYSDGAGDKSDDQTKLDSFNGPIGQDPSGHNLAEVANLQQAFTNWAKHSDLALAVEPNKIESSIGKTQVTSILGSLSNFQSNCNPSTHRYVRYYELDLHGQYQFY